MPQRAPKICGYASCSKIAYEGKYCDAHRERETGWGRRQSLKGNRHQRGYGNDWDKLRKKILKRDRHICINHLYNLGKYVPANIVDHIIPKAEGGTDAEDNLQAICGECHKAKTQQEATRGRGG